MKDAGLFGLVLAGGVALVAAMLQTWESHRPEWIPRSRPERLSRRLRRAGVMLLWFEAFLIAIGSLLPIEGRNDRILFVSVWGLAGLLTIVLVSVAFADSVVRFLVGRSIANALAKSRKRTPGTGPPSDDDQSDPLTDDPEFRNP